MGQGCKCSRPLQDVLESGIVTDENASQGSNSVVRIYHLKEPGYVSITPSEKSLDVSR